MYILVFIPFFFEGVEGYIFMERSPGFEIGKLGNYDNMKKSSVTISYQNMNTERENDIQKFQSVSINKKRSGGSKE